MGNTSESGIEVTFNKSKTTNDKEETVEKVVEEVIDKQEEVEIDDELDLVYTDIRSVTIKLVKNYSLFRKKNDKHMPKRRDYIGSSINSSRVLASNPKELEKYFPNIVGVPANNADFMIRVKQYLNNIRIYVDEIGRKFDVSFIYEKKRDYLRFLREEEEIEKEYNLVNKQDISALRKALDIKITKLNVLETKKCMFGNPMNVEDYLMYRHCLLYKDVAKDISLINSDSNIRFYFEDDKREENKLKQHRLEVKNAKINYVKCLSDDNLFDAVYIQYCVLNNLPLISSMALDRLTREVRLDEFSTAEPKKFNSIMKNKDIKLASAIEHLIARGELIRPQYSQNILNTDGDLIGANMIETIGWFKNPNNTELVNVYMNKLKNI